MTMLPQVAHAIREMLTTVAEAAARTTRFFRRRSPLSGATFSQTVVFGFLRNPAASLEELSQTAAALGVAITPQALAQRFTEAAADCLKEVLHAALARVIAAAPSPSHCWRALRRSRSRIARRSSCPMLSRLCGRAAGSTSARTTAALKRQVRLEMRAGRLAVQLQDGRAADQAAQFPGRLAAGALHMADLGYWTMATRCALRPAKALTGSLLRIMPGSNSNASIPHT